MTSPKLKKNISFFDALTLDFWRYFGKAILLFFPAIIFLLFSYFAFWNLGPAKDLMVMSLEKNYVFGYCLIALLFWTYVTWYTSRLVSKAKQFKAPDDNFIWTAMQMQFPRVLAFSCFTIIILAYLQLPYISGISRTEANILFITSFVIYFFIYAIGDKLTDRFLNDNEREIKYLKKLRAIIYSVLIVISAAAIASQKIYGLIIMLFCWQVGIVMLLVLRRKLVEAKDHAFFKQSQTQQNKTKNSSIIKQVNALVFDKEDSPYFRAFVVVSTVAIIIYFATIFSISFSVRVGAFPFTLLAFGVLLCYINFVAFFSVLTRFNFHVLFITLAIIIGSFIEPHYAKLIKKDHPEFSLKKRQHLNEYFKNWFNDSARNKLLNTDSLKEYPVYFVLANGGGARSAYWVASVLSRFEDETKGNFSKHLFGLSGASGGTWGNAVFFDLLINKNKLLLQDNSDTAFQNASKKYLNNDFLTYTLARMLGPDIFRHIFPLTKAYDRDAALADAMEEVPGEKNFMYNNLAIGFSSFSTQQGQQNYSLPILCLNTTRMQDGVPGVVCNIDMSDNYFNKRLEVLNMIDEEKDLKLSTAVVLGGSSPYINSAQRIDEKRMNNKTGKEEVHPQYFVDGGYFDNSGAGVVNEMIIELLRLIKTDSSLLKNSKLKFYVLHITNDPVDESDPGGVSPLVNDLASPFKTLMGSYGSQTSINDLRLKNYMQSVYGDDKHYIELDLYKKNDPMSYPVNWVISGHVVDSINNRVNTYEKIQQLIQQMNSSFK